MLRVDKFFQETSDCLIVSLLTPKAWKLRGFGSRVYIQIKSENGRFKCLYLKNKPVIDSKRQLGFSQICRKYLGGSLCLGPSRAAADASFDLWFRTGGGEQDLFLLSASERSGLLTLVNLEKGLSLARMNQSSLFTKPQNLEGSLLSALWPLPFSKENPLPEWDEILFDGQKTKDKLQDIVSSSSLNSAIKRRLRTLRKKLAKEGSFELIDNEVLTLRGEVELLNSHLSQVNANDQKGIELNKAFMKIKKLQRSKDFLTRNLSKLGIQIGHLEEALKLNLNDSPEQRKLLDLPLKQKKVSLVSAEKVSSKKTARQIGRKFKSDDGRMIRVAKNAVDGDILLRYGNSSEHWLHCTTGTGSHVLVEARKNDNEWLSERPLFQAAILALHYSDHRQSKSGELWVSRRRFLRKTKGLPAGKWLVDRCSSVRIQYDDSDLELLLRTRNDS